jgi:hypothetical protein
MIDAPISSPLSGSLRFIRYAFMPNRLRYCGGDDNRTLFEYGIENAVDGGLNPLLRRFTGALPYLQLIASANGIADAFDPRVVEAYWIGTSCWTTLRSANSTTTCSSASESSFRAGRASWFWARPRLARDRTTASMSSTCTVA